MNVQVVEPRADILVESTRSIGYTFESALADIIDKLLNSKEARHRLGNAGYEVLIENRGALQRLLDLLHPYLTHISENHK